MVTYDEAAEGPRANTRTHVRFFEVWSIFQIRLCIAAFTLADAMVPAESEVYQYQNSDV